MERGLDRRCSLFSNSEFQDIARALISEPLLRRRRYDDQLKSPSLTS